MRFNWVWALVLVSVSTLAADRDTLPLREKPRGPVRQDVKPLAQPGNGPGTATGGPSSAPSTNPAAAPLGAADSSKPTEAIMMAAAEPYVASLDTFGSSRVNELVVKNSLGKELETWLHKGLEGDSGSVELEERLAAKIKAKFDFAEADWSIVQYFEPGDMAIHITLDVVEKADVKKRMPFHPEPTATLADPANLLMKWREYEETALQLVETGQLDPESETCVAFHCPFGHKNPKLKPYETVFVDGVRLNGDKLFEILAKDRRADWRAAAAYLIAYHKDGKRVVSALVDRIKDPDSLVRNNVLRVLGDIAELRKELVIPTHPVLEALNYPRVSDRSKALYVVYLLALNSQQLRDELLRNSVPVLLQLLASKQPDHREITHGILRKLSGRDFVATDTRAWNSWFQRLPKDRTPSNRK